MKIKSIFVAVLAAMLGAVGPSLTFADISELSAPLSAMPGGTITGPVTNVDPVNKKIQIKATNGLIQTFVIDQDVAITRNDAAASLANIKVGDVVTLKAVKPDSNP